MLAVLAWWLIMEVLGLAAFPLTLWLFRGLPDRGYAFAKPLGLLLTSYALWILATFGFLRNSWGGIAFCILLVAAGSAYLGRYHNAAGFLRRNKRIVAAEELIFTSAFALFALFRAYNPEIMGTEKPMEFAFLNACLRSERFPPHDPWLSDFAISYYYFGYLMMALLTKLSGVPSSVAFNLGITLLFALTATGAFSLVYGLVQEGSKRLTGGYQVLFALLGAVLVAVIGNLEGLLEILHAHGIGSAGFWHWIDVKNLAAAPLSNRWYPIDNWWWWRASRVIHDRDLLGQDVEVIDEFPFFSFMLGDMHPHVLALPFVLLALALALNILLRDKGQGIKGQLPASSFQHLVLYALCLGALGFLNTWDFPVYLFVVVMAYALRRYEGTSGKLAWDVLGKAMALGGLGLLLYLPFYLSFQSQAGGPLPNLIWVTRLNQYLIMFGPFIFTIAFFLAAQLKRVLSLRDERNRRRFKPMALAFEGLLTFLALTFLFPSLALLAVVPILFTKSGQAFLRNALKIEAVRQAMAGQDVSSVVHRAISIRLGNPWLFVTLASLIALTILLLRCNLRLQRPASSTLFALLLIFTGLLLTLSVEFVYLRDVFGTRMNTMFKFYYQAWVMLAIASAYGAFRIVSGGGRAGRWLFSCGFVLLLAAGMVYPVAAGYTKAGGFRGRPTLDGLAWVRRCSPDEYAAIRWLNEHVKDTPVILEASGGSFTEYGRVSSRTGLPTLLGWGGHELQWRGSYEEPGKREPDIDAIYSTLDIQKALSLLEKYDVEYVYVGPLERKKYDRLSLAKFEKFMDVAYRQGQVTIYRRRTSR